MKINTTHTTYTDNKNEIIINPNKMLIMDAEELECIFDQMFAIKMGWADKVIPFWNETIVEIWMEY